MFIISKNTFAHSVIRDVTMNNVCIGESLSNHLHMQSYLRYKATVYCMNSFSVI